MFFVYLAATTVVVATAIITVVVSAATVTITAEQNEDYKDDNPRAVITIVEKATHILNPLSMHNMIFRFFCYKRNIYLFKEKNKSEYHRKGGFDMGFGFDFEKYKKHSPTDMRDLISDEYDYEYADEFDYVFDDDFEDFDEDNEFGM